MRGIKLFFQFSIIAVQFYLEVSELQFTWLIDYTRKALSKFMTTVLYLNAPNLNHAFCGELFSAVDKSPDRLNY